MQQDLSTSLLFHQETTFISDATSQDAVFKEIAQKLYQQELVTADFLENLISREANYPTGLDLTVISSHYPNIAIPHTESEFVKTCRIVPVKLNYPITFHNMIAPDASFEVRFLFMILNDDLGDQAGILANIMDFLNRTPKDDLMAFFQLESTESIYQFLANHFQN